MSLNCDRCGQPAAVTIEPRLTEMQHALGLDATGIGGLFCEQDAFVVQGKAAEMGIIITQVPTEGGLPFIARK